jgi:hypothetical protein
MGEVTCIDCGTLIIRGEKYCGPCNEPIVFGPRAMWGEVLEELRKEVVDADRKYRDHLRSASD